MGQKQPLNLTVPCRVCAGSGCVPLPSYLSETLELFHPGASLCAEQVKELLHNESSPNAMNARLETLRQIGLINRCKIGKRWFYSSVITLTNHEHRRTRRRSAAVPAAVAAATGADAGSVLDAQRGAAGTEE